MKPVPAFFAVLLASLSAVRAAEPLPAFTPGARILFQGDSITDGNRGRNADPNHILGDGYVFIIAAKFGAAFPEAKLEFFNRGVSGNTVWDDVHPTYSGHQILADEWERAVRDFWK